MYCFNVVMFWFCFQGIAFVDTMNDICNRRKVDPTLVESDSIKWVLLFSP